MKSVGSARSEPLPNGAPWRRIAVGSGFFGNREVRVESRRQEPLWGGHGDVASRGPAPDPLRHGARRVDELTGVIASEGPGSHAPPVSHRKSLEIAAATYGK